MYSVRAVEPGDHDQLRQFRCMGSYSPWTKRVQEIIRGQDFRGALLDPNRSMEALAAVDENGLFLGVIALEPAADDPTTWSIHALGIKDGHRHQGIGTELFDAALDRCRAAGANSAVVEVHRRNAYAIIILTRANAVWSEHPYDPDRYFQGSILLIEDKSDSDSGEGHDDVKGIALNDHDGN